MKNTFGNQISLTLFGESHGEAIGCVIDGLPAGVLIDMELIKKRLSKRRPSEKSDTPRVEMDNFSILSGVFNGKTTGTPLCVVIPNENTKSGDYSYGTARPSHADYTAHIKYHGCEDYRGGGHFSGRITAALVLAGAIFETMLDKVGIKIGTHILSLGGVYDREFDDPNSQAALVKEMAFPVLDDVKGEMLEKIEEARADKDSLGGILETAICGVPAGVGEPWFDSLEGMLSHALFSIGGIKGVEFGSGFKLANMRGSQANDQFYVENGTIKTCTNHSGGINGGISNGMPIILRCAVKPTPSISKLQNTVNFISNENEVLEIKGRHDPAIVRRASIVIDSICALVVADMLATKFGIDYFTKD
ncbi:MAG: chorismate synthase [Clostridia bacterium]|nr:chorismate synthase [Clostridia bacterium]